MLYQSENQRERKSRSPVKSVLTRKCVVKATFHMRITEGKPKGGRAKLTNMTRLPVVRVNIVSIKIAGDYVPGSPPAGGSKAAKSRMPTVKVI